MTVLCSWCRQYYSEPVLYHVCPDGATFADRLAKSSEEIMNEHYRQDRLRAGYRAMESKEPSTNLALTREPGYAMVPWTTEDIKLLKAMKINPW